MGGVGVTRGLAYLILWGPELLNYPYLGSRVSSAPEQRNTTCISNLHSPRSPERILETATPCSSRAFVLLAPNRSRFLGRGCDEALFSKKRGFQGGRRSVNEGLGKDFYREGSSVKRSGPFSELADSEN